MIDPNGLAHLHCPGIQPGHAKVIAQVAGLFPKVQQLNEGGWFLLHAVTLPYVAQSTIPNVARDTINVWRCQ